MNSNKSSDIKKKAAEWGKKGEQITCEYLIKNNFPITETNWRFGNRLEIDIISQQGDEMVFIEVKTRNGKFQQAEDAIDLKKMKLIVRAADIYLKAQEQDFSARFDVALIEGTPDDYEFTYIKEAFLPPPNFK